MPSGSKRKATRAPSASADTLAKKRTLSRASSQVTAADASRRSRIDSDTDSDRGATSRLPSTPAPSPVTRSHGTSAAAVAPAVHPTYQRKHTVIAPWANKGGVGKTTVAFNLAFALAARQHKRVLVLDVDAKCTLTDMMLEFSTTARVDARTSTDNKLIGEQYSLAEWADVTAELANEATTAAHFPPTKLAVVQKRAPVRPFRITPPFTAATREEKSGYRVRPESAVNPFVRAPVLTASNSIAMLLHDALHRPRDVESMFDPASPTSAARAPTRVWSATTEPRDEAATASASSSSSTQTSSGCVLLVPGSPKLDRAHSHYRQEMVSETEIGGRARLSTMYAVINCLAERYGIDIVLLDLPPSDDWTTSLWIYACDALLPCVEPSHLSATSLTTLVKFTLPRWTDARKALYNALRGVKSTRGSRYVPPATPPSILCVLVNRITDTVMAATPSDGGLVRTCDQLSSDFIYFVDKLVGNGTIAVPFMRSDDELIRESGVPLVLRVLPVEVLRLVDEDGSSLGARLGAAVHSYEWLARIVSTATPDTFASS